MATYAININERSVAGRGLLAYLQALDVIIEQLTPRKKNGLDVALDDVKHGRVYHAANAEQMFKDILG